MYEQFVFLYLITPPKTPPNDLHITGIIYNPFPIMAQLPQKAVVITGASSGIGRSLAVAFRNAGYQPINWDLHAPVPSPGECDDIPSFQCDVTNEASVQAAYEATKAAHGVPYGLINNAGLQFLSPVETFPLDKWRLVTDVLLTGTFLCSRAVIKDMKATGAGGRIINISSIHGKLASPYKAAYVAAKHGVLGFAKVLALEVASSKITVNTICPGFVDTPLMRGQVKEQMALGGLGEAEVMEKVFLKDQAVQELTKPEQVASLALYLASDAASTVTGEAWNISGGWGMGL